MNYYNKTNASVKTFLQMVKGRNRKTNRTTIYRALLKKPNATKNQLIAITGLSHQTLTSQLSFLMDFGLVEVTGGQQYIASAGVVYESFFKVQTDENKIYINQVARRKLKLKRIKKKLKEFSDVITPELMNQIQTL